MLLWNHGGVGATIIGGSKSLLAQVLSLQLETVVSVNPAGVRPPTVRPPKGIRLPTVRPHMPNHVTQAALTANNKIVTAPHQ
jgi:hypothetical protein